MHLHLPQVYIYRVNISKNNDILTFNITTGQSFSNCMLKLLSIAPIITLKLLSKRPARFNLHTLLNLIWGVVELVPLAKMTHDSPWGFLTMTVISFMDMNLEFIYDEWNSTSFYFRKL